MLKIGLTGGIASGKSSVAKWFSDKGVPVFDADKSVHEQYTSPVVISKIKETFGEEYVQDGVINRPMLSRTVFNNPKLKEELEHIFHPLVLEHLKYQCHLWESQKKKFIILDIPLLFEVGWDTIADQIWVVYVPEAIQINRLMIRNGYTLEEARQRIKVQMPLSEKAAQADIVIDNAGSWSDTVKQLDTIYQELSI